MSRLTVSLTISAAMLSFAIDARGTSQLALEQVQIAGSGCNVRVIASDAETPDSGVKAELVIDVHDIFGNRLSRESTAVRITNNVSELSLVRVSREQRVAIVRAELLAADGRSLARAQTYVAVEPVTLKRIDGSDRFGVSCFPYLSGEQQVRYLSLLSASGIRSMRGFEMDRCYDHERRSITTKQMNQVTAALRNAGLTCLVSVLGYSPLWGSTAAQDRPELERRWSMPQMDVWLPLVAQYVKETDFDAYEVWNEPNGDSWQTQPRHETYAALLKQTAEVVRQSKPAAKIVGCSTNYGGPEWPEKVLERAGRESMDVISFHPYRLGPWQGLIPPEISEPHLPSLQEIIRSTDAMSRSRNGGRKIPIWVTEIGVPSEDHGDWRTDVLDQALHVPRSLLLLASEGVEKSFWFAMYDVSGTSWGLVTQDLRIKPAWWAMRTLNEHAAKRQIRPAEQLTTDLLCVTLVGQTDNVLAVWSARYPAVVAVTDLAAAACDLFGRTLQGVRVAGVNLFVLPAGSTIYLRGKGLTPVQIQPLLELRRVGEAGVGKAIEYEVRAETAARTILQDIPGSAAAKLEVKSSEWCRHCSTVVLTTPVVELNIPVSEPVSKD